MPNNLNTTQSASSDTAPAGQNSSVKLALAVLLAGVLLFIGALFTAPDLFDGKLLQYAVSLRPGHVKAQMKLAAVYRANGHDDWAIDLYLRILGRNPALTDVRLTLGGLFESRGQDAEAAAQYQEVLKNGENAEAHFGMGNLQLKQKGKTDEAIRQFQLALNLDPKLAAAHNSLANALVEQHRMPEAIQHYKDALKWSPGFALAHYNYAMALEDQEKFTEAAQEYAEAGRLGVSLANYYFNYGNLLNKLGKFAEAEPYLSKAAAASPKHEEAQYQYALALDRLGKYSEAIERYSAVLQLWHDHPETLNKLALIYLTASDPNVRSAKMSVLLATRACAATGYENVEQLDTLARACAADNDFTNAVKWEDRAILRSLNRGDEKLLKEMRERMAAFQANKVN